MINPITLMNLLFKDKSFLPYLKAIVFFFSLFWCLNCLTAQSDLTVSITTEEPVASNGQYVWYSLEITNNGDSSAISPKAVVRFSTDSNLSASDSLIPVYGIGNLDAGETKILKRIFLLPFNNSFSGTGYFIANADPQNKISELDENNNIGKTAIEISIQHPPEECTFQIGPGELLCFQKNANVVELFAEQDDGTVQEYQIGLMGEVEAVGSPFVPAFDSIYIKNGEVVKKLANGTIAWQKPIPLEVYNYFTDLDAVAETVDSSIVFAGFIKKPEESKAILKLLKTSSNLSVDTIIELDTNIYQYLDTLLLPDTVYLIDNKMNGNLNIFYGQYASSFFPSFNSHFIAFDVNTYSTLIHENYYYEEIKKIDKTSCNSYQIKSNGIYGSGFSNSRWNATWWVNNDNGQVLNWTGLRGTWNDVFGSSYSLNSSQSHPDIMHLSSTYITDYNNQYLSMGYTLPQMNSPNETVFMDFSPFLSTLRTGEQDLMIFGKTGDSLWVNIPTICRKGFYLVKEIIHLCPGSFFGDEQIFNNTIVFDTILVENDLDTIFRYNLRTYQIYEHQIGAAICEGDYYDFGNLKLTQSGNYSNIFQSQYGCDSTVHLNLEVIPLDTINVSLVICQGETSPLSGNVYGSIGTYLEEAVFQNQYGCDSTVFAMLEVKSVDSVEQEFDLCVGEVSPLTQELYATPGQFLEEAVFQNQYGCDSVVTAMIAVHPEEFINAEHYVPYGYVLNGDTLTQDTATTMFDTTEFGCPLTIGIYWAVGPNAVNDFGNTIALDVFPNPFKNGFYLQFKLEYSMELEINVYNVLGMRIDQIEGKQKYSSGEHQIFFPTSEWPSGVSILTVKNRDKVVTNRLIKVE